MVNKESPADKAKREAEEKAEVARQRKLKEEEKAAKAFDGDAAEKLSDEASKDAEKTADDVSTDEGEPVEQAGPVMVEVPEPQKNTPLTDEELSELVGELEPGDEGYLPLDAHGHIIGSAKKGKPPQGEFGAAVRAIVQRQPLALATPSGAPITKMMNPSFAAPVKPRYG